MNILFVENHARFSRIVTERFLSDHAVTIVPTVAGARDALARERYDVVLLDYELDDGDGTEVLPVVRRLEMRPLVIASSAHTAGNAALVQAGADGTCRKLDFAYISTVMSRLLARRLRAGA